VQGFCPALNLRAEKQAIFETILIDKKLSFTELVEAKVRVIHIELHSDFQDRHDLLLSHAMRICCREAVALLVVGWLVIDFVGNEGLGRHE
jgi:hypothetical protein